MHVCLNCGKPLRLKNRMYCSNKCQRAFAYKSWIERWKRGEETGVRGDYLTSNYIKRYLCEKYGNKCSRCGWHRVNPFTKTLPLEVEHIDGDYTNNTEENLDLVCPNCHSLTATWKGANKGHGRKDRRKYR